MKDFQNELADVHAMNIRDAEDRSLPVGKEISGMHLLPGQFFKHAQSSKVVGNAIAKRGENPIVNKKNQTLVQRHIAYRGPDGKSTSIDEKRLVFYRRAADFSERASFASQVIEPAFEALMKSPSESSIAVSNKQESQTILGCMSRLFAAACDEPLSAEARKDLLQRGQL